MDGYLNVVTVGHRQTVIDGRWSRAPILVEFQTTCAGDDLFLKRGRTRSVSFAQEAKVHREVLHGLEHARYIPCTRRAGSRVRAGCRSRAASDHGRRSIRERFVNLLRGYEMNMAVDASRGNNHVFARDNLG